MRKIDWDATPGEKLLRLFQKLVADGRKHYQSDLAEYLVCSPQTVIRLVATIESVIGASLASGLDNRRRWYQIKSISRNRLGLEFEELRYLSICRDLAEPFLSEEIKSRVDESIFNFSLLLADEEYARREGAQRHQFGNCLKGWIDYTPFFASIEKLLDARERKKACIVLYLSAKSEEIKEHRFALGRIVRMNNALYALGAGLTEDFKNMRHLTNLAIHRIKEVIITDMPVSFKIPEDNLDLFGLPWNEPRKYRVHFKAGRAARYVEERIWSARQTIERLEDGSIILEMISRSDPEVRAWIRSFGGEADLLKCESWEEPGDADENA